MTDVVSVSHPIEAPTPASAHEALERLYGPHTEDIWRTLLHSAGLAGDETDPAAFGRIVVSMQAAEPVTRLCGRALAMRAATFAKLTVAPAPSPMPSPDLLVSGPEVNW